MNKHYDVIRNEIQTREANNRVLNLLKQSQHLNSVEDIVPIVQRTNLQKMKKNAATQREHRKNLVPNSILSRNQQETRAVKPPSRSPVQQQSEKSRSESLRPSTNDQQPLVDSSPRLSSTETTHGVLDSSTPSENSRAAPANSRALSSDATPLSVASSSPRKVESSTLPKGKVNSNRSGTSRVVYSSKSFGTEFVVQSTTKKKRKAVFRPPPPLTAAQEAQLQEKKRSARRKEATERLLERRTLQEARRNRVSPLFSIVGPIGLILHVGKKCQKEAKGTRNR